MGLPLRHGDVQERTSPTRTSISHQSGLVFPFSGSLYFELNPTALVRLGKTKTFFNRVPIANGTGRGPFPGLSRPDSITRPGSSSREQKRGHLIVPEAGRPVQ